MLVYWNIMVNYLKLNWNYFFVFYLHLNCHYDRIFSEGNLLFKVTGVSTYTEWFEDFWWITLAFKCRFLINHLPRYLSTDLIVFATSVISLSVKCWSGLKRNREKPEINELLCCKITLSVSTTRKKEEKVRLKRTWMLALREVVHDRRTWFSLEVWVVMKSRKWENDS